MKNNYSSKDLRHDLKYLKRIYDMKQLDRDNDEKYSNGVYDFAMEYCGNDAELNEIEAVYNLVYNLLEEGLI